MSYTIYTWSPRFETLDWDTTLAEPTHGVAIQLAGDLAHARVKCVNDGLIKILTWYFCVHLRFMSMNQTDAFPPDSDFWLRDAQGQIVRESPWRLNE